MQIHGNTHMLHVTAVWRHGLKTIATALPVAAWRHGPQIMHKLRHNSSHESHCAASYPLKNGTERKGAMPVQGRSLLLCVGTMELKSRRTNTRSTDPGKYPHSELMGTMPGLARSAASCQASGHTGVEGNELRRLNRPTSASSCCPSARPRPAPSSWTCTWRDPWRSPTRRT